MQSPIQPKNDYRPPKLPLRISEEMIFAGEEAAERWFAEHDPEGVAFEYEVME